MSPPVSGKRGGGGEVVADGTARSLASVTVLTVDHVTLQRAGQDVSCHLGRPGELGGLHPAKPSLLWRQCVGSEDRFSS